MREVLMPWANIRRLWAGCDVFLASRFDSSYVPYLGDNDRYQFGIGFAEGKNNCWPAGRNAAMLRWPSGDASQSISSFAPL